jgi:chemotaxis protein MotA
MIMDLTTIIGVLAGIVCVAISIFMKGDIMSFLDPASIFIVGGGVLCATIASFPIYRLKNLIKAVRNAFKKEEIDFQKDVEDLISMANIARREGILSLEETAEETTDPFLKKGIMLIVDGSDPELIKGIMETELAFIKERHADSRIILDSMASYSPAFGMIGTLIGLINMLENLTDMEALGPNMAVALVTTFYGTMLANLVFSPLSKKLKAVGGQEYLRKELMLEGLLSIQDGENPRIIREKLNAFLSRAQLQETKVSLGEKETEEEKVVRQQS